MRILISGGSGSGKSEFAESLVQKFPETTRIYLATMMRYGKEDEERIQRHRQMRMDKGFTTVEQPKDVGALELLQKPIVVLECLSNLLANEMFDGNPAEHEGNIAEKILEDLAHLEKNSSHFLIVTNEIFSDGCSYPEETREYIRQLGYLNQQLTKSFDLVYEVVCGIPICLKGEAL